MCESYGSIFFFMKLETCSRVGWAGSVLNQIWGWYLSPRGNEISPQLLRHLINESQVWVPVGDNLIWEGGRRVCHYHSHSCLLYSSPGSDLSEQEGAGQVIASPGFRSKSFLPCPGHFKRSVFTVDLGSIPFRSWSIWEANRTRIWNWVQPPQSPWDLSWNGLTLWAVVLSPVRTEVTYTVSCCANFTQLY